MVVRNDRNMARRHDRHVFNYGAREVKTVVVGLIFAFLLFTPQGRAVDVLALDFGVQMFSPPQPQIDQWGYRTGSPEHTLSRLLGCDAKSPNCGS
jgi:hypothetical protein